MKITFVVDNGANIHSARKETYELEELGIEQDEWDEMDDDARYQLAEDMMMQHVEIYYEVHK